MGEWLFITFALTGRSSGFYVTQGVALGSGLVGLSARAWPLTIVLWTRWAYSPCLAADNRALGLLGFQPVLRRLYCRERPERAASSQTRATPWVSVHNSQRPVRAKVK